MDQEIDLRPYLRVLVKRWRLIRDVIIVAVVSSFLFTLLTTPRTHLYEARAGVAIVKTRSQITFDPKFTTQDLAAMTDATSRRNTLAALVKNPLLAQEVSKDLGSQIPPELQGPETLLSMVEGVVGKSGDLIEVRVQGTNPEPLALIANSWAMAYERLVNRIYATGGGSSVASLQKEVALAQAEYGKTSEALIQFSADNRIDQLTRLVDERKKTMESLEKGRQEAIAAVIKKEAETRSQVVSQYVAAALNVAMVPLTKQAEGKVQSLSNLYAAKIKMEQVLEDARTLRDQASANGASANTNSLAVMLLKAQLASSGGLPANLQIQVGSPPSSEGSAGQVEDLQALIRTLETRLKEVDSDIQQQSRELMANEGVKLVQARSSDGRIDPLIAAAQARARELLQLQVMEDAVAGLDSDSAMGQSLDRLNQEILQYEGALARETATRLELTRARDLAWETYSTLARKVEEVNIAAQVPGTEVTFALPAVRPQQPLPVAGRQQNVAVAAVLGLVVGVLGAFALEYYSPAVPTPAIPWMAPPLWVRRRLGNGSSGIARVEHSPSISGSPDV